MDPIAANLISFQELPIITDNHIAQLIQSGRKLLFMHDLIIDIDNFNHPGNLKALEAFINKPDFDISNSFKTFMHSHNAEMLVCLKTIGKRQRIKSSELQNSHQGKQLYEKVRALERNRIHQTALSKIDFSQPLTRQLEALSPLQKSVIVDIPKIFGNPSKIMFKQTPLQEALYMNYFWPATITFQIIIVGMLAYLFSHYQIEELLFNFPFLLFGLFKWTFLEYMFHRFDLHYDVMTNPKLGVHLIHHAFPNIKGKLPMPISVVLMSMIIFYFAYQLFLTEVQTVLLMSGVMFGVTLYDILHYYSHFGPETSIKLINDLKRNHLKHHFRDSTKGFGVSTIFWDKVFGTEHAKN